MKLGHNPLCNTETIPRVLLQRLKKKTLLQICDSYSVSHWPLCAKRQRARLVSKTSSGALVQWWVVVDATSFRCRISPGHLPPCGRRCPSRPSRSAWKCRCTSEDRGTSATPRRCYLSQRRRSFQTGSKVCHFETANEYVINITSQNTNGHNTNHGSADNSS